MVLALKLIFLFSSVFAAESVYDGYKVYDIKVQTAADLNVLENLELADSEARSLDFLSFHNRIGDVAKLAVKPEEQSFIEDLFRVNNLDYEVTVKNLQE